MDTILPAYNDPLFSVLIITILVLIVTISSIVLGNYKEKNRRNSLKQFLSGFKKEPTLLKIEEMPFEERLIEPLSLLVKAFKAQGKYQKSINLNLYLIANINDFYKKEGLLEELGETYLKAGFLKRSQLIYLEILSKHARNPKALKCLSIVYEMMHQFDKALETVLPLKILGEDTEKLEAHLQLSKLLEDKQRTKAQKVTQLVSLLEEKPFLYRRIIQALFTLDLALAWEKVDTQNIEKILDILWLLPPSNLNFDIISKSETLCTIYLAKGYLKEETANYESNIFAIDTIISAKRSDNHQVDLLFSYGCESCKSHFPISFIRCPKCYTIATINIKETLVQKRSQTCYSLL